MVHNLISRVVHIVIDKSNKLEKIKNQTESESFKTNEEENKVSINPPKENEVKEIKKKKLKVKKKLIQMIVIYL